MRYIAKGRRLMRAELNEIANHAKLWPDHQKKMMAKLFTHIKFQEDEIYRLERKLQPSLEQIKDEAAKRWVRPRIEPETPYNPWPKARRCAQYILENKVDTKEFESFLKFAKLKREDALAAGNQWLQKNQGEI